MRITGARRGSGCGLAGRFDRAQREARRIAEERVPVLAPLVISHAEQISIRLGYNAGRRR